MKPRYILLVIPLLIIGIFVYAYANQDEAVIKDDLSQYKYATFAAG